MLSYFNHCRSVRPSTLLVLYLSIRCLSGAARTRTLWLIPGPSNAAIPFTVGVVCTLLSLFLESIEKNNSLMASAEKPKHQSPTVAFGSGQVSCGSLEHSERVMRKYCLFMTFRSWFQSSTAKAWHESCKIAGGKLVSNVRVDEPTKGPVADESLKVTSQRNTLSFGPVSRRILLHSCPVLCPVFSCPGSFSVSRSLSTQQCLGLEIPSLQCLLERRLLGLMLWSIWDWLYVQELHLLFSS